MPKISRYSGLCFVTRLSMKLRVIAILAGSLFSSSGIPDTLAPPKSYTIELNDYFFVMRSGYSQLGGTYSIDEQYQSSGLYPKNSKTIPVWTVDWYAFSVNISRNGRYLIRHGPWAGSTEQLAISFYRDGRLLAEYRIKDLVDNEKKLARTTSHFFWKKKENFDQDNRTYFIKTIDDNEFTFDVTSGNILTFKHFSGPLFNARVTLNDSIHIVRDFRACSLLMDTGALGEDLENRSVLGYTTTNSQNKDQSITEVLSTVSYPFEVIKEITSLGVKNNSATWRISMNNGKYVDIEVNDMFAGYCGIDQLGESVKFDPVIISSIVLNKAPPKKDTPRVRTKEQRMRNATRHRMETHAIALMEAEQRKKQMKELEERKAKQARELKDHQLKRKAKEREKNKRLVEILDFTEELVQNWLADNNDTRHQWVKGYKLEAFCRNDVESPIKSRSVRILNQILAKEEQLHKVEHEHLLMLNQFLAICHAAVGDASKSHESFMSALNNEMRLRLPTKFTLNRGDLSKPYFVKLARYLLNTKKRVSESNLVALRQHLHRYKIFDSFEGALTVNTVIVDILKNRKGTNADMAYFEKGLAYSKEAYHARGYSSEYLEWLADFYAKFADKNETKHRYIENQIRRSSDKK